MGSAASNLGAVKRSLEKIQKPETQKNVVTQKLEASSHDRINMTEFRLEHDQNFLQQRTLTLEHDQKIDNDEHY